MADFDNNHDRNRGSKPKSKSHSRSQRNSAHSNDRTTQISKALSLILRHRARDLGIAMDSRGFVAVDELLRHQRFRSLHVSLPDIKAVVDGNAKQRFELIVLPLPPSLSTTTPVAGDEGAVLTATATTTEESGLDNSANYLIRASQGHSIKGLSLETLLTPVLPEDADFPTEVVHGTYASTWPLILASGGLKPMGRVHIHFATGMPDQGHQQQQKPGQQVQGLQEDKTEEEEGGVSVVPNAPPVVSGMRASANLLVWVDVKRASEAGVKWWRSRNGVVLTEGILKEGQSEGLLPLEYVSRAVERRTGKVVWQSEVANET